MQSSRTTTFRGWIIAGLILATAGVGACAAVAGQSPTLLWQSYYFGLIVWWPVAMGGLGLLALGNLTGGRWAAAARPFYLSASRTVPWLTVLFIPLAFGLRHIFPWAQTEHGGEGGFSPSKAVYLSPPFFLARAAGYFVVWLFVARWLGAQSRLDRPPASRPAMRRAGAISLVLLVPTATFAAFDWMMSLEPHWYSSIYGAIVTAGGVVAVQALALIGLAWTSAADRADLYVTRIHGNEAEAEQYANVLNDLGNLLLSFIMVWTYFSFSQFFLIWSANLPSEIVWYQRRLSDGWEYMALAVVAACFAVPFAMLLSRDAKRAPARLAAVAGVVLVGYVLHMYWMLAPALGKDTAESLRAMIAAAVAGGGVGIVLYGWGLSRLRSNMARPGRTRSR